MPGAGTYDEMHRAGMRGSSAARSGVAVTGKTADRQAFLMLAGRRSLRVRKPVRGQSAAWMRW